VDDPGGVCLVEDRRDRAQHLEHAIVRERSAGVEQLAERLARQQRHLQHDHVFGVLDALHRDDVRILERRRDLGFAIDLLDRVRVNPGDLQRDILLVGEACGANDDTAAPKAQPLRDRVPAVYDAA
jgi:hypothetical protein